MPKPKARRYARWLWLALPVALGGALWGGWRSARPRLLVNHARYLTVAGRYQEALGAWDRAQAAYESAGQKTLPPPQQKAGAGADWTLGKAMEAWQAAPPAPGSPALRQCLAFFDEAARRPDVGSRADLCRLALLAASDAPSSLTLAAARAVLKNNSRNPDALWWTVRLTYDPANPLAIPREALQIPLMDSAPSLFQSSAAAAPTGAELTAARASCLKALRELSQADWAAAAFDLNAFLRMPQSASLAPKNWLNALRLPLGLALLRAGRPAEAVASLEQTAAECPSASAEAIATLLQARWALGDLSGAAEAASKLRQTQPERLPQAWQNLTSTLPRWSPSSTTPGVPLALANAAQLAWLAGLPAEGLPALAGLENRLEQTPLTGRQRLDWIECLLAQNRPGAAAKLLPPLAQEGQTSAPALTASLRRALAWLAKNNAAAHGEASAETGKTGDAQPLARLTAGQLLSSQSTIHLPLAPPPQASVIVILAQGYPEKEIWPTLHAQSGASGATWYLTASRVAPRALFLPLPPGGGSELSCSLLNADENGGRSILLAGLFLF